MDPELDWIEMLNQLVRAASQTEKGDAAKTRQKAADQSIRVW